MFQVIFIEVHLEIDTKIASGYSRRNIMVDEE
jgi:hypothetical protein